MGYEVRLYVVDVGRLKDPEYDKYFANVVATIDLAKCQIPCRFFNKVTDCYIYSDDGNTEFLEDCYGEPLTECSDIPGFIEWMKKENGEYPYRRFLLAIGLLESICPADWRDLRVLHYGH